MSAIKDSGTALRLFIKMLRMPYPESGPANRERKWAAREVQSSGRTVPELFMDG